MIVLVLLTQASAALAGARDVVEDAGDGRIDLCYPYADFRDALAQARADQRLYANEIDVIKEGMVTNVAVKGQPCGSGRSVPARADDVGGSGAGGLWAGALAVVVVAGVGGGALARRRGR